MTDDLYQEIILEEYRHPHNQGELADADFTIHERNSSCGDEFTVQVKVSPSNIIEKIQWQGQGCAISIAAMSVVSQYFKNKPVSDLQHFFRENMAELLGIREISVGRVKCLMLGLTALKKFHLPRK